jgi:HEPN domain-containing protein
MDEATLIEVKQWVLKAEHDLKSADLLLNDHDPIRDTGVYHCQQAAEKLLKAYLTSKETVFSKTHDLRVLLLLCQNIDQAFEQFVGAADTLTPYAVTFRYPGDVLEPSDDEAKEALLLAKTMMAFVLGKINHDI